MKYVAFPGPEYRRPNGQIFHSLNLSTLGQVDRRFQEDRAHLPNYKFVSCNRLEHLQLPQH